MDSHALYRVPGGNAEGSVQALVERESEATESQDQEKEIENHSCSLSDFSNGH